MDLSGKTCVIVGGFGGTGMGICGELLRKRIAHLFILDKSPNVSCETELKRMAMNTTITFYTFDVTDNIDKLSQTFQQIMEIVPKVDVLVNCAGILDERYIESTIEINLLGLIKTTDVAFEFCDKRHGGQGCLIVNISSVSGLHPIPLTPIYCTTKAGIVHFTKCIAGLQPFSGISAFVICPALTETALLTDVTTYRDFSPETVEKFNNLPRQTAEICGINIVKTIEKNQNGSIWILEDGKMRTIESASLWKAPEILK